MKVPSYSSLAAFLAHYQSLKSAPALTRDEPALLAAMEELMRLVAPEEREAILGAAAAGPTARRRERAARRLGRELSARRILKG